MTKTTLYLSIAALTASFPLGLSGQNTTHTEALQTYRTLMTRSGYQGRTEVVATQGSNTLTMGYTDRQVPADAEMPENMKSWLRCVDKAAEYTNEHPELKLGTAQTGSVEIAPLLGTIMWNQSAPYSNLCPKGTPVGCVATAMAQVMYYYRYPEHGFGEHAYVWNSDTLKVNFEDTYYQWDNMFDCYNAECTDEQRYAVAELSYHCGVSVDMSYAPEGSGAWLEGVPYSLNKYFGYNSQAIDLKRNCFSYEEWCDLLISELEEGRPVIFAANNNEVGHCFVIDGINREGLFHVNWGWGGAYNGYFDIGILNPEGAGIGGTVDIVGYCLNQGAVVQLCPEEGVGIDYCPVTYEIYYYKTANGKESLQNIYQNNSALKFTGVISFDLIAGDGTHYTSIETKEHHFGPFGGGQYWKWSSIDINGTGIPDGTYELAAYCMIPERDSTRYEMMNSKCYDKAMVTISNQKVTSFEGLDFNIAFDIEDINYAGVDTLALGRPYDIELEVTSLCKETFVGQALLYFGRESKYGETEWEDNFGSGDLILAPGEKRTVTIPITLKQEGDWEVAIVFNPYAYDNSYAIQVEEFSKVHVEFTAESPASLVLDSAPVLKTERCEADGEVEFELTVNNAGGNFSDQMAIRFYTGKNASSSVALTIEQEQQVEMMTDGVVVNIIGTLTGLKGMTKYYARPYYMSEKGSYEQLLLTTGKAAPIEVKVYNATGIEQVIVDETEETEAYDLMGRRISGERTRGFRIERHAAQLR